jgi:cytochrome c553
VSEATALAICDDRVIRLSDLPADIRRYAPQLPGQGQDADFTAAACAQISLESAERQALVQVIEQNRWTVFRSGARVDTAMQIVAAHSTLGNPQHIAAIANYLSRLDANPNPVEGSGEHLRVGQELYAHICAACHGVNGPGEPVNRVPRIAGQHYPYLRRQIEAAGALHKDLAPPEMTSALRGMRPQEKDALADYISRLGNSEALLDSNRP